MAGRRMSTPCLYPSVHYRYRSRYSLGYDLASNDDSETRTEFAKKLEKELNRLKGIDWSVHTADYSKLRKQLQRIVYAEDKSGDDFAAVRRNHDVFFSMLQAEVSKVISCVRNQRSTCEGLLNDCALDEDQNYYHRNPSLASTATLPDDSDSSPSSPASSPVFSSMPASSGGSYPTFSLKMAIAFARAVYEQQPEMAKRLLPPSLLANLPAHPVAFSHSEPHEVPADVDAYSYTLCRKFLGVAKAVDELRRFLLLNSIVIWKIVCKYGFNVKMGSEEHHKLVNKYQEFLPVYESSAVDTLTHRVAKIMDKLIGSVEAEETRERRSTLNLACALCSKSLDSSSVPLGCGHRLDFPCLLRSANIKGIACPVCQNQNEIDKICIDTLLSQLNELSLSHSSYRPPTTVNTINSSNGAKIPTIVKGCEILPPSAKPEKPVMAFASTVLPGSYMSNGSKNGNKTLTCKTVGSSPTMAATVCVSASPISESSSGFTFRSNCKNRSLNGASCHQCKTNKDPSQLLFCTNRAEKHLRKRRCRKKFCDSCLKRSYPLHIFEHDGTTWECPSCLQMCICAACSRRQLPSKSSVESSPKSSPSVGALKPESTDEISTEIHNRIHHNHNASSSQNSTVKLEPLTSFTVKTEPLDLGRSKYEFFNAPLSTSLYTQTNDSPVSPLSLATSPNETPNLKARYAQLPTGGNSPTKVDDLAMTTFALLEQSNTNNNIHIPSNNELYHQYGNQTGSSQPTSSNGKSITLSIHGKTDSMDFALPFSPTNSLLKNKQYRPKIEIDSVSVDSHISSTSVSRPLSTHHTPQHSLSLTIDGTLFGNQSYQFSPRILQGNIIDPNLLSNSGISNDNANSTHSSLLIPHSNDLMVSTPSHSRIPSFSGFMGFQSDPLFMSDGDSFSLLSPQHRVHHSNELSHTPTSSVHKRIWSLDMGDPFTNAER